MNITCSSPTCTAQLPGSFQVRLFPEMLEHYGRLQQQPGDDVARAYCERCKL